MQPNRARPPTDTDYANTPPLTEITPSFLSGLPGTIITTPLNYIKSNTPIQILLDKTKHHNSKQSPSDHDPLRIKKRLLELTQSYKQVSEDEYSFSSMDIRITDMLRYKEDADFWRTVKEKRNFFPNKSEAIFDVYCDLLIAKAGGPNAALLKILSFNLLNEITVNLFVQKLLEHGASPFCVNDNDDTPLHLVAKTGHAQVAKLLIENLAISYAHNKDLKKPLELAIENDDDVMGALIVKTMPPSEVRRVFVNPSHDIKSEHNCMVTYTLQSLLERKMAKTTLAVLDSAIVQDKVHKNMIRVYFDMIECDLKGNTPNNSNYDHHSQRSLRIISQSGYEDIAYHDVVRLLLHYKWKYYGKYHFYARVILHIVIMIAMILAFVLAGRSKNPARYCANPTDIIRAVCEVIYILVLIYKFINELYQIYKDNFNYFHYHNIQNYADMVFIFSSLSAIIIRFIANEYMIFELFRVHYILLSFAYITYFLKSYKLLMITEKTGALLEICIRILCSDVMSFTLIFGIFLLASSGSLYLALRSESLTLKTYTDDFFLSCPSRSNNTRPPQCAALSYLVGEFHYVLITGFRVLLDAQSIFKFFAPCDNCGFGFLSTIYYFAFQFGVVVVLLNLLIAQMSATYEKVFSDATRKFYTNRALLLSRMEHHSFTNMLPRRICNLKWYKESMKVSKQEIDKILRKGNGESRKYFYDNNAMSETMEAIKECYDTISEMKYFLQHQQLFIERALCGSLQSSDETRKFSALPRVIRHHDKGVLIGDTSLATIEQICEGLVEIRKYLNETTQKIEEIQEENIMKKLESEEATVIQICDNVVNLEGDETIVLARLDDDKLTEEPLAESDRDATIFENFKV